MRFVTGIIVACTLLSSSVCAQTNAPAVRPGAAEKIIIDTDIGSDIDDAFAVGLALHSPEFKILGLTSAWGDTHLRARLLSRFLKETGRTDIPIAMEWFRCRTSLRRRHRDHPSSPTSRAHFDQLELLRRVRKAKRAHAVRPSLRAAASGAIGARGEKGSAVTARVTRGPGLAPAGCPLRPAG